MEQRELTMVKELCALEDGLSANDVKFVESLSHRPVTYQLSPAQLKWLEDLWERECLRKSR